MSTATLDNFPAPPPNFSRAPSYTAEPQNDEQRLAHVRRPQPSQFTDFVKQSKNGDCRLRLVQQENSAVLPSYGSGGIVAGTVDLAKTDAITSVEAKIEGRLMLKEIGGSGSESLQICLDRTLLYVKDRSGNGPSCPSQLDFSLQLPTTFEYRGVTYPLPPSFEVHLSGVPGFRANIEYSVSAAVNKPSTKTLFGVTVGNIVVSTPFICLPRNRPAVPTPQPMSPTSNGLAPTSEWKSFESSIKAKSGGQDITAKLYLPTTRIFCMRQPIPFHLVFSSSAFALAAFLPLTPSTMASNKRITRVQLLRQSTVDVRNTIILGTKTDMWRVDRIGEGTFKHAGDGPDWIAFRGSIAIDPSITVSGFNAGGLHVKDCIVFSMDPPEPSKSPYTSLRQVIPVRLTTDPYSADGSGLGVDRYEGQDEFSIPSTPEEADGTAEDDPPKLFYAH